MLVSRYNRTGNVHSSFAFFSMATFAWNQVCESYGEDILGVLDFGRSEPSQHESKHGGEVRSEISQMQVAR